VQDKDAKVAYLTKAIAVVSLVLGQPVPAKPLKVWVAAAFLSTCLSTDVPLRLLAALFLS
jgi:hypothetical protein